MQLAAAAEWSDYRVGADVLLLTLHALCSIRSSSTRLNTVYIVVSVALLKLGPPFITHFCMTAAVPVTLRFAPARADVLLNILRDGSTTESMLGKPPQTSAPMFVAEK